MKNQSIRLKTVFIACMLQLNIYGDSATTAPPSGSKVAALKAIGKAAIGKNVAVSLMSGNIAGAVSGAAANVAGSQTLKDAGYTKTVAAANLAKENSGVVTGAIGLTMASGAALPALALAAAGVAVVGGGAYVAYKAYEGGYYSKGLKAAKGALGMGTPKKTSGDSGDTGQNVSGDGTAVNSGAPTPTAKPDLGTGTAVNSGAPTKATKSSMFTFGSKSKKTSGDSGDTGQNVSGDSGTAVNSATPKT